MSAHDKAPPPGAPRLAPHLAAALPYARAPLKVTKPCAYCNRQATHGFALPQYGAQKRLFLCAEHKGHEKP